MRYIVFPAVLLLAITASSQKVKFDEGYIIKKAGDTLRGLLYWKKNPTAEDSLQFKKTSEYVPQSFAWNDLNGAYNNDSRQELKICTVKRTLEYIDGNDFTIRFPDSTAVQAIPLLPVYKGAKLSLYQFYDKSLFFFIYDGKQMLQLVQRYRYTNRVERMFDYEKGRRFHISDEFKSLLSTYYNFVDDSKMRYMLNNTLYEQGSLRSIISKMDKKLR